MQPLELSVSRKFETDSLHLFLYYLKEAINNVSDSENCVICVGKKLEYCLLPLAISKNICVLGTICLERLRICSFNIFTEILGKICTYTYNTSHGNNLIGKPDTAILQLFFLHSLKSNVSVMFFRS